MDQKSIWRQIRVGAKEMSEKLTDADIYTSEAFRSHVQATVDSITKDLDKHISVSLMHDPKSDITALTDGNNLYLNTANGVIRWYKLPSSRFATVMGNVYHELAHIRFHDFRADVLADRELKENGTLYGRMPEPDDETELDEMKEALKHPEYREVFKTLRDELINCIIDAHDEERMSDYYGGIVSRSIEMVASSIQGQLRTLEGYVNNKKEPLSIMTSLVLQFARFGEILVADEQTLYTNEYAKKLMSLSQAIELATTTDNPKELYSQINVMLLFMWPYIKDAIEKCDKQQSSQAGQGQQGQGNQSGSDQNGQGGQQGQPASSGGQGSQNQQQGGGGISQPSANAIQQVLQQIAQGAQNGGGSQMPQNQKASNVAKQATKDAQSADKKKGKKNDSGSGSGGNDANKGNVPAAVAGKSGDGQDKNGKQEQADSMLANVLQTIISSVAGNMAEAQMEQDLKSQIIADVDIMDRSSTHKGHSIDVKREVEVTPSNIKLYGEMMEDVSQYSKRLAKLMQQELKDLQDGDVRRNRMYGRDIVASEMWRPDCRFFSDTKLPQDLPDMAVSVLVDQSGSMYGQRMGAAMKATMLLHDFAERVHVPVAVYGHNVTMHGRVNLFVYTDFLKAGKRDKYRLAKLSTGGCNRDGAALEVVANLLNARPERTKLLIIISDGKPNDDSYGGDSAAKDIKDIVARNRRRGVEIVAAAIGDDKEYLKKIYGDQFLDITDLSTFPKAMVKIVKKRLKV